MTGFGAFQASVQGMKGQSHALATIGTNIVNATTTGYKRAETHFETVLGTVSQGGRYGSGAAVAGVDYGGIGVVDMGRVRDGGEIAATGGALDVAIDGRGFFSVARDRTGAEPVLFTRDGSFDMGIGDTASAVGVGVSDPDEGYLLDRNGNYVLGWAMADDGLTAAGGQPAGMRIDTDAFTDTGRPTGEASLNANLPAMAAVGTSQSYRMDVFDSAGQLRGLDIIFGRTPTAGAWSLLFADAAGDPVAVDPPAAGGPGNGADLQFDPFGQVTGPARYQVNVNHADGNATAFTLDLGAMTQFAGDFVLRDVDQDGYGPGALSSIAFDGDGQIVGTFDNGNSRPLYQLAIADFINPDGLERRSGNLFAATEASGEVLLGQAGTGAVGAIRAGSLERSNVALEDEFSRMIQTQNAYNASATAFRTVDEMMTTARDMRS